MKKFLCCYFLFYVSIGFCQPAQQPFLLQATDSSINIHWRGKGTVLDWWRQSENRKKTTNADGGKGVSLSGLQSGVFYRYQVAGGAANTFQLPPQTTSTTPLQFIVLGDCGTGQQAQKNLVPALQPFINGTAFNAVLLLGDNAYPNGLEADYQRNFFDVYADDLLHRFPLYPTPGNHDYMDAKQARLKHNTAYFDIFPSANKIPYYSVNIGNVHLVSLDSYGWDSDGSRLSDTSGAQARWLKQDLEKYKQSGQDWLVLFWHHPPYSMGTHNSDKERELTVLRKRLLPIIERYSADLVLCGHSHVYERTGLINGFYGKAKSFSAVKHLQGRQQGNKHYKQQQGTMYVVSGLSGGPGGRQKKSYPHPAMQYSNHNAAGALVLQVQGKTLRLQWVTEGGKVGDEAIIIK